MSNLYIDLTHICTNVSGKDSATWCCHPGPHNGYRIDVEIPSELFKLPCGLFF